MLRASLRFVGAALCIAACGRSDLDVAAATSGASSSSSSGSGGCAPLGLTPSIAVVAPEDTTARAPRLLPAGGDGSRVILAYSSFDSENGAFQVRHVSFAPWAAWPDVDLAPSHLATPQGGESFRVAPGAAGTFALLAGDEPFSSDPTSGAVLDLGLSPEQEGPIAPLVIDPEGRAARFLTSGPRHLAGYLRREPEKGYQLEIGIGEAAAMGPVFQGPTHLGCALGPLATVALPVQGGWLVALSNGTDLGDPGCLDDGLVGPATQVQVAFVDPSLALEKRATWGTLTDEPFAQGVDDLALTPRPGGSWLVWFAPASASEPDAIRAALLGPGGEWINDFALTDPMAPKGTTPIAQGFAAAPVGDRLAIAWLGEVQGEFDAAPQLFVAIVGPSGAILGTTEVPTEGEVKVALTLLASPDGDALLLSWSATLGGVSDRVHAVRVDCLPGG